MESAALQYRHGIVSNKYRTALSDKVRVCFYARVSTKHEEQMNALDNQVQWYDTILSHYPNWQLTKIYVDRGVTGTQARKRQGFMSMIEDAKSGMFDLVCTREVSRFARNTLDSLQYTRELKDMGVEVYFYNDNIWSCESDGELRLTIMSAMAQEEARHISERVLAGQSISRKKGVLYGNGNILGYRLVKGKDSSENTYEIIEEDAETVRMIYDLYLDGMGCKGIASRMQELHRQSAVAGCKWDGTKVLRILNNKTYAGYIGYNKSHTKNFLGHVRVNNSDRSQYEYVKGNFPAIIPEDKWNQVQVLKSKKVTYLDGLVIGKKRSDDKWARILVCECGSTFKRYKWRINKTGERVFGYQCWNQVNHRKRSFHIRNGLDGEGYCDLPSICEWKLDFMLKSILCRIWENPKETVSVLTEVITENYVQDNSGLTSEQERLQREHTRLKTRIESLCDKLVDGLIDDNTYQKKHGEYSGRLKEIELKLQSFAKADEVETMEDVSSTVERIQAALENVCDLEQKQVSEELVDCLVERMIPMESGVYKWYLKNGMPEDLIFDEEKYLLYDSFTLTFDEALAYRKKYGNYTRAKQWKDLKVEVYMKKN